MIVKKIDIDKLVTNKDLDNFLKLSPIQNYQSGWSSLDLGIELPIIALNFGHDYNTLVMANPKVVETSKDKIVYYEMDNKKRKLRKTTRLKSITIETSNHGKISFGTERDSWKDFDDLMSDHQLFECVTIQRLIDAIHGIDITDPLRRYNEQVIKNEFVPRNKKVMLQSKNGDTVFVKYKHADKYLQKGYEVL